MDKKMKTTQIFSLIFMLMMLGGCATEVVQKYPMLRTDAEKVTTTDAVIVFDQEKVDAEVEPSGMADMMGGGAIWAIGDLLVESKRKSTAQKDMAPILTALKSSSLGQQVYNDLSSRLRSIGWLHVNDVAIIGSEEQFDEDKIMDGRPNRDVLLVHITNSFPMGKRSINTTAKVLMRLKAASTTHSVNKRDAIILDKAFVASVSLPDSYAYDLDPVPFWSANHGEPIITDIKKNTQAIAADIVTALNQPFNAMQ